MLVCFRSDGSIGEAAPGVMVFTSRTWTVAARYGDYTRTEGHLEQRGRYVIGPPFAPEHS